MEVHLGRKGSEGGKLLGPKSLMANDRLKACWLRPKKNVGS
jgi:hypothetical protein